MKKTLSFLLMFSLLSFSLFSTGCGKSSGGIGKIIGSIAILTISLSSGGAVSPVAFAANVRGSTVEKLDPAKITVKVYDGTTLLSGLEANLETKKANELEFKVKGNYDKTKEYTFVVEYDTKPFMRNITKVSKDQQKVKVDSSTEVKVQVYEEWKKDNTITNNKFENFEENLLVAAGMNIDALATSYLNNVSKWVKDNTQALIDKTEIETEAKKVGKEDLATANGEKLANYVPTALQDVEWVNVTEEELEALVGKTLEMAYVYDNDFDYSYENDVREYNIVKYNVKRWLNVQGVKPHIKFKPTSQLDSLAIGVEDLGTALNKTTSTITLTAAMLEKASGSYDYLKKGHFDYVEYDEQAGTLEYDEQAGTLEYESQILIKKGVKGNDTYYIVFSSDEEIFTSGRHYLDDMKDGWFLNEEDSYEIYKLTN